MSQVRIPPVLRDVVGESRELAAGGPTVAAVLDDLFASHPALRDPLGDQGRLSPLVNTVRQRPGHPAPGGPQHGGNDVVILLPAMVWRLLAAPGLTALLRS